MRQVLAESSSSHRANMHPSLAGNPFRALRDACGKLNLVPVAALNRAMACRGNGEDAANSAVGRFLEWSLPLEVKALQQGPL